MNTATSDAPHVVMIVGNNVRTDTRVRKAAVSLVRCGLSVTVLGISDNGERAETLLAGARVIRVPVPPTFRDSGARTTLLPPLRIGYSNHGAQLARLRLSIRRRDLRAWAGRRRYGPAAWPPYGRLIATAWWAVGDASLAAAAKAVSASRRLQRKLDRWRDTPTSTGGVPWRLRLPAVIDYENAFIDEIVALRPDAIHAHDVEMVGVADKAASILGPNGRAVPWIYDAHEFVAGLSLYGRRTAVVRAAWTDLEATYASRAHRIITVSSALAAELRRRYRPARPPAVVLNAPWLRPVEQVGGVRSAVGLAASEQLIVYSGGLTPARGVQIVVEALQHLPDVHLAIVGVPPGSAYGPRLLASADELGVAERVHLTTPVQPSDVVSHLATADIGVVPFLRFPNHDVALPNKLFEYLHAGLPVVVSDCPEQAQLVTRTGVGEVHQAGDARDLARAVQEVLVSTTTYRAAIDSSGIRDQYSWQRAEAELAEVYRDVLDNAVRKPEPVDDFPRLEEEPAELGGPPSS